MKTAKPASAGASKLPPLVAGQVVHIPVGQLTPDPEQARTTFDPAALDDLTADIKARGVEHPLIIYSDYTIKDGERRWRAAKKAGAKTVPCLLAEARGEESQVAIERLLDQAADNDHAKNLGPMDWARFLKKLVEVHKLPVKDIPELLEKRGIRHISRPHVSNLMRLTDLPDWARALIEDGRLPPAAGKYILMTKPHAPAMTKLKTDLLAKAKRLGEGEQLDENVEYEVGRAYRATSICLSESWTSNVPIFPWQTSCKACPNRQRVRDNDYCLDKKCFDKKQDEARAKAKTKAKSESSRTVSSKPKKPAGPTKVKPDDKGVIHVNRLGADKYKFLDSHGVRFEPAMHCAGCEHNKQAVQYKNDAPRACCFNLPCFEQKQRNGSREEGVAQWLDKRVLPEVLAKLKGNHDLQFQLVAWMALDAPTQTDDHRKVLDELRTEQRKVRHQNQLHEPGAVIRAYAGQMLDVEAIAAAGARAMVADRGHFYAFARHLGVQVTPAIASMDKEYLELKRKPELLALLVRRTIKRTQEAGLVTLTTTKQIDAEALGKKKLAEILEVCLLPEIVEQVGVPPDVKALYENLRPAIDAEVLEDETYDLDDPDNEDADEAFDDDGEDTPVEEDTDED